MAHGEVRLRHLQGTISLERPSSDIPAQEFWSQPKVCPAQRDAHFSGW
jgi:hypothetical protein